MSYAEMIAAKRDELRNAGRAILSRAEAENRTALTADEQHQFNEITAALESQADVRSQINERDASNKRIEGRMRDLANATKHSGFAGAADTRWLPGLAEYRELVTESRAVGTSGAFIPVDYYGRFWDQLRKRVGVLDAGPVIIDITGAHSVKVPLVNSSVSVGTVAEATTITPSDPGLSNITLTPKKLAALTIVDREAIEDSNPALLAVVENSLTRDFAVALDAQLVAGDGTGQNLTGLTGLAGTTSGAATGTNGGSLSATAGFGYLADTLGAYEAANADPDKAAWLMHSRTWASIRKISDAQSRPILAADPTQALRPTLFGKPVYISNSIPTAQTVGTSSDCSTLILADFSQIVIAAARQLELVMSTDAYFATDQVGLRITGRYDIGSPQPAAIVKTVGLRP
jgi:HK97 family phage major capsid protein